MSQEAAARPSCTRCGGCLIPSRDLTTGRVESVSCAICGETLYRNHERRKPNLKEADTTAGKSVSRHNDTPRASHKRRAA